MELAIQAKAIEADNYVLNETVDPWKTDMTMEQNTLVRAWVQTFKEDQPANTIKVQDDTLLSTSESEHNELEKNIHK
eukprot:9988856-Heterocapsa_arctica.AAC.1